MSLTGNITVFLLCLAASLGASEVLVRGIDQLSTRLRLSGGMVGLLTALGADSPEISSALVALFTGASDVGVGVIFGSNLFNLAVLLGVSAVVATRISVAPELVMLHGGVALVVTLVVAAGTLHIVPSLVMAALLLVIVVPYVVILALRPHQISALPVPIAALLRPLVECTEEEAATEQIHSGTGEGQSGYFCPTPTNVK